MLYVILYTCPFTHSAVTTNILFMRLLIFTFKCLYFSALIECKLKTRYIDHHYCMFIAGKTQTGSRCINDTCLSLPYHAKEKSADCLSTFCQGSFNSLYTCNSYRALKAHLWNENSHVILFFVY